jgi:hypothetical protein
MGAARAWTTMRTICGGCGDPLTALDLGRDYCLLCRDAKARGPAAWARRMRILRRTKRPGPRIPDVGPVDPFKGFREGDE